MPNSNCLEGMQCPKCESEGPFNIRAEVSVTVSDEGTEDDGQDYEWNREGACRCLACGFDDIVDGFTIERMRYAELKANAEDPKLIAFELEVEQIHHDFRGGKYDAAKRDELLKMVRKAVIEYGREKADGDKVPNAD